MRVCNLLSGSKGNSTYVETKNHKILIDIGTSCKNIENLLAKINLSPSDIDIVLITHSHIDHVLGVKTFNKKYKPRFYIDREIVVESKFEDVNFNILDSLNDVKDIRINSIPLSHDVQKINGYIIEEGQSSLVYITDTGYISEKNFEKLKNKNIYVFESNHDVEMLMNNSRYPHKTKIRILSDKGHLSNKDSAYYLSKLIGPNTKEILLAHLSEQNNTEQLAYNTLFDTLNNKTRTMPNISIARQNEISKMYQI